MDKPCPSNVSLHKRNPKGKFVLSGQKDIIINMYKRRIAKDPEIQYVPLINFLSMQTGVGKNTIKKTLAEYKATGKVTSPNKKKIRLNIVEKTSDAHLLAIRKKIYEFWLRREMPNLNKILEAINSDNDLPSFSRSTMHRLLRRIEFKFINRKGASALIDKPYIISWRQQYIQTIKKLREEGRLVYYLDETSYNVEEEKQSSTGKAAASGRGKRLIIGHVGSFEGFVPGALLCFEARKTTGDYHTEINGDTFFQWFCKFLPMLRDGAVIVMDSAPYHSVQMEEFPTFGWKKNDIVAWLEGKGETVSPLHVKMQLLNMVEKFKDQGKKYVIDEYAKERGYTVLRLPPYHSELNPIELAWTKIKQFIRARNTTYELADVRELIDEAVEIVSAKNWKNFIRHAREEEERFVELDHTIDSVLDESGDWLDASDCSDIDV